MIPVKIASDNSFSLYRCENPQTLQRPSYVGHRERSKQQSLLLPFLTDVFTVDWGTHYPATIGARLCKTYLFPCVLIIIQWKKKTP